MAPVLNTHSTEAYAFLKALVTKDADWTHACLTGGLFRVREGPHADGLDELLAKAIRYDEPLRPTLPPLTQRRTFHFPLYVDLDLKLARAVLDDDAVRRIAATLAKAVMRFWPGVNDPALFECVVCTRTGDAECVDEAKGLYKHGMHVHWHRVVVDLAMALQIREGMVLDVAHDERLAELNAECGPIAWADAIDASVYGNAKTQSQGSLRLVGCPKAVKCPCHGKDPPCAHGCDSANNHCKVDPRVYAFRAALRGEEECAEYAARLRAKAALLVKHTSVRAPEGAARLPGYAVYEGCPAPGAGKRAGARGAAAVPPEFKRAEEVGSAAVHAVVKRLLRAHSAMYEPTHFKVKRSSHRGTTRYFVDLWGEHANYCLNKRDFHPGNRAYMIIEPPAKRASGYTSRMRCWCRCEKPRPTNQFCRNASSLPVALDSQEAALLFRGSVDPLAARRAAAAAAAAPSGGLFDPVVAVEREIAALEAEAAAEAAAVAEAAAKAAKAAEAARAAEAAKAAAAAEAAEAAGWGA